MKKPNLYLDRYAWPIKEFEKTAPSDLELIIVIPAYNEHSLLRAIRSINSCEDKTNTLIIVIFNESENESEEISQVNQKALQELQSETFDIPVWSKLVQLPAKKAGVGLARKIGMDEAVRIFEAQNTIGIIACYDADCTCSPNYISEIKNFYQNKDNNLGLVHYEHDLRGDNYEAIVNYELYLRYYVDGLRWAGFPFAFQTLGSCITVRSDAYQKQGGMNTRKAGEDFYFIHNLTPLNGIGEINAACITPSDRVSDRVPFGTGHAVQKYLDQASRDYEVYNPTIFVEIKHFIDGVPFLYECDSPSQIGFSDKVSSFLEHANFESAFQKIKKNSANESGFNRQLYQWFDGFRVLKMTHFLRDEYFPNIDIVDALGWLNHEYLKIPHFGGSKEEKLMALRDFDRQTDFQIRL